MSAESSESDQAVMIQDLITRDNVYHSNNDSSDILAEIRDIVHHSNNDASDILAEMKGCKEVFDQCDKKISHL